MTADLSAKVSEVLAGQRRARPWPTLLVASLVTAIVAIPLVVRSGDVEAKPVPADPASITVDLADSEPGPLDGATISGNAMIAISASHVTGASFSLFPAGEKVASLTSQDLEGPVFSPVRNSNGADRPLDTTLLANGPYELFVVMDTIQGEERTAIGFEVANP